MYCMDNKTLKFVIIVTVSYHKTVCIHFTESATGTVIFFVRLSFANTFFFFFFPIWSDVLLFYFNFQNSS